MALRITHKHWITTRFGTGVIGSSEWATYCSFSVSCKANRDSCIWSINGLIKESIILIARKIKCRCRYYQCKNALIRQTVGSIPSACGPRPETSHFHRTNRDSYANLNKSTSCMQREYFPLSKNIYLIEILKWISHCEI